MPARLHASTRIERLDVHLIEEWRGWWIVEGDGCEGSDAIEFLRLIADKSHDGGPVIGDCHVATWYPTEQLARNAFECRRDLEDSG